MRVTLLLGPVRQPGGGAAAPRAADAAGWSRAVRHAGQGSAGSTLLLPGAVDAVGRLLPAPVALNSLVESALVQY